VVTLATAAGSSWSSGSNEERTVKATVATTMPLIHSTMKARLMTRAFAETRIRMAAMIAVG